MAAATRETQPRQETPADMARRLCDEGVDIHQAWLLIQSNRVTVNVVNFMGFQTLEIQEVGERLVRVSWFPKNKFKPSPTPESEPTPSWSSSSSLYGYPYGWDW